MRILHVSLVLAVCAACSAEETSPATSDSVPVSDFVVETIDEITLYGEWTRPPGDHDVPLILAFHQGAASGQAEYGPIIPRLLEEGYAVLTVDQRRGGERFGGVNRTVAALNGVEEPYCTVYLDLEAVLEYAMTLDGISEIIAWGSSYSASLVVLLAVNHPEIISKVVSFSPASSEVMDGCRPVPRAAQLATPALFLRPEAEMEIDSVAEDFRQFALQGHETYVASPGTHGSSMLVPDRIGANADSTWMVVLDYLAQ